MGILSLKFLNILIDRSVKQMNIKLFNTRIRESMILCEAQGMQMNILECSPRSKPSLDYQMLTGEILESMNQEAEMKRIVG